jgi:hypothetical protein
MTADLTDCHEKPDGDAETGIRRKESDQSSCHLSGYTWLDAAINAVGDHGYTILSDNGDGDGPAAILINDETLASARKLIGQLYELGERVDTATPVELAKIDKARADINEVLADVFEQLLLEAGLVQPLVSSEDS